MWPGTRRPWPTSSSTSMARRSCRNRSRGVGCVRNVLPGGRNGNTERYSETGELVIATVAEFHPENLVSFNDRLKRMSQPSKFITYSIGGLSLFAGVLFIALAPLMYALQVPRSKRRTKNYSITDSLSRTSVHAQLRARGSN
jgi:hypothetical protein